MIVLPSGANQLFYLYFFLLIIHSICNESAAYQYVHSCDYNLNASLLTGHLCCMKITEDIPVYKAK